MFLSKLLKSIGEFFSRLWHGLLPELKAAIHVGVTITNAIKTFDANNPEILDIISHILPGDLPKEIIAKMRVELPKICVELRLVDATLGLTDPNEIVKAAVKTIQQLSGDYKSAFLNSFSIIVAQVAADGKLDWNDAAYLLKWYYDNQAKLTPPVDANPTTDAPKV